METFDPYYTQYNENLLTSSEVELMETFFFVEEIFDIKSSSDFLGS